MSAAVVFARVHLQGLESLKAARWRLSGCLGADERSNRRSQLLRNCLNCVLTARIFLLFDLSSAVQNICFIYLHSFIQPSRV